METKEETIKESPIKTEERFFEALANYAENDDFEHIVQAFAHQDIIWHEKEWKQFIEYIRSQAVKNRDKEWEKTVRGMMKHSDGSKCTECIIPSGGICRYDMALNDLLEHESPTLKH